MILDIDDFKQVNDTYGHLQGDEVLRMIGEILLDESRGVDEPARYGGEEFVVALPETGAEGALEVAERVRRRVEQTRVTRLDGVRRAAGHRQRRRGDDAGGGARRAQLIAVADDALYEAKRAGKNRCVEVEPSHEPASRAPRRDTGVRAANIAPTRPRKRAQCGNMSSACRPFPGETLQPVCRTVNGNSRRSHS